MRVAVCALAAAIVLAVGSGVGAETERVVEAAKRDDVAAVRGLLKQKADVNLPQRDGATALHWAAHWDDLEIADALIGAGANVNAANDLGVTPLWLACLNGSAGMVERLLKAGADGNAPLPSGETPLMTAARVGSVDAVKLLLADGVDVNARESVKHQTALMWAVVQQHPEVVKVLLAGGADVSARSDVRPRRVNTDAGGFNPGSTREIKQGGYTPLLFAAQQGDLDSAKLLVAAGASVNELAPDGTSVLVVATHSGHGKLAAFLLESGADPNAAEAGYTALQAAILRSDEPLVKLLLARGANPNTPLTQGTPVRRASADYALEGQYVGASPLWLAARFAQPGIMQLLVASGADPLLVPPDGTSLIAAAAQGTRRVEPGFTRDQAADERAVLATVGLAVSLGVDPNVSNKDGNTPLHTAAQKKLTTVVQLLADSGANLEAKNKKGQTPLSLAGAPAREGAVNATGDLLRKLGAKE